MLQCCILSNDEDFGRFLYLVLKQKLEYIEVTSSPKKAHYTLVDMDSYTGEVPRDGLVLYISYDKEKPQRDLSLFLQRPFRPLRLLAILGLSSKPLSEYLLDENTHSIFLFNEQIALSKKEYALFVYLYNKENKYVSEKELQEQVFSQSISESNVVRVYIHYLRNKLEKDGVKRILHHQEFGYMLKKGVD